MFKSVNRDKVKDLKQRPEENWLMPTVEEFGHKFLKVAYKLYNCVDPSGSLVNEVRCLSMNVNTIYC